MKNDRTTEQRIADIIDEQSMFDVAGVRNTRQIAKAIMTMLNKRRGPSVTNGMRATEGDCK